MKGHFIVILNIDGMGGGTSKFFMDYLTAEDIKGIEIVYILTAKRGYDFAILHITTYADTKNLSHEPGTYVYKPITFTRPTQFYRPRYTAKNSTIAIGTDLRSTIHWEPNIITDKDGKALVSFYSADKPADYNVVVEGTDLKGDIGTERAKIKIVSKQDMP